MKYLQRFEMKMLVYPPVKWEGIMDAVNRLPVDVAERYSSVRKDAGRDENEGCMVQESRLYCVVPRISYVASEACCRFGKLHQMQHSTEMLDCLQRSLHWKRPK